MIRKSSYWSYILQHLGLVNKRANILVIGLDNAGKTTILNNLCPSSSPIVPTIGFQVKSFTKNHISFTAIDMSGQGKYRDLWSHYYNDSDALIFVIDSSDRLRCAVAREELELLLNHPTIVSKHAPILFLANKNDLDECMTAAELGNILGLNGIKGHNWYIAACNGLTGDGLSVGVEWLVNALETFS